MKIMFSPNFKDKLKREVGLIFSIIFVVVFLFVVTRSSNSRGRLGLLPPEQRILVGSELSTLLTGEDRVFLATIDADLRAKVGGLASKTYNVELNNSDKFDQDLQSWLDLRCSNGDQVLGRDFLVWTKDHEGTLNGLAQVSRSLAFFTYFEAVVPYRTRELAQLVDKIILLRPRRRMIDRYCEVKSHLVKDQMALAVVEAGDFHLIGAVRTGRIIWLPSNETRNISRENYTVKNLPVFLDPAQWFPSFVSKWSFVNQETAAYSRAIAELRSRQGIILVERTSELGSVPTRFLQPCTGKQSESGIFREACLK